MPPVRSSSLIARDALCRVSHILALVAAAACGGGGDGGGGGGGGGNPTQPVSNTPARVDVTPGAPATLTSGGTLTLNANAFTSDGRSLGAAGITWSSSNDGVASVAAGVVTARLVGTATITATAGTASGSVSVSVTPGVATQLAIRTQPVAGTAYAVFTTPAVVELRDAAGNVSTSTAAVTAAIATGGGDLGGSATINAVAGVATFTNLTVNGTAGARTLTFSSGAFPAVTSESFNVATAPPAAIGLAQTTLSITALSGTSPAAPSDVNVTNTGVFPLTNLRAQSTTYNPLAPGGWLAVSFPSGTSAPATLRLTVTSAALAVGTYTATIVVAGDGATATQNLTVNLTVAATLVNTYGTAANKISLVAIGSNVSPGLVTTASGAPAAPDASVTYLSRSPATATVDATGRITGVGAGQTWIVANSAVANPDSVQVIVPRQAGVVLRTDLTAYSYRVSDIVTLRLQLDTRGATVGSFIATVSWPVTVGSAGTQSPLTFLDITTTGSPVAPTSTIDNAIQVIRFIGGASAGVTGVVEIATIRFRAARTGNSAIFATALEVLGVDLGNLAATATSTSYPVIVSP